MSRVSPGNLILHFQQILDLRFVAANPLIVIGRGIDQSSRDSPSLSGMRHRSFQHSVYSEFLCNPGD